MEVKTMANTSKANSSKVGGPFHFPFAAKKEVPTKEQLEEKKRNEDLLKLYGRVKDRDGLTDEETRAYALMYNDLAPGDLVGEISARRVKKFFDEFIQEDNPSMYNRMLSYYEISSHNTYSEKKLEKLSRQIQNYMESIRTIDNAMRYSVSFEKAAREMAKKLDAPKSMSVNERVKWIRLWFIVLRDHECFFNELDDTGRLKGPKVTEEVNQMYFFPESMINLNASYLSYMEDGNIIYDMIKEFIDTYPDDVKDVVYRFAELDGVNRPDSCRLGRIREDIKRKLFPNSWRSSTIYFMTKEGAKFIIPKHLKLAVLAYKNGGISKMPTFTNQIIDVFNAYKRRTVTAYKYGETTINGKPIELGVSSNQELMLYVNLYKWLLDHPGFRFGEEEKTLEEYGLTTLLFDSRMAVTAWILENGYAVSDEDINWHMVGTVLNPDENSELFMDYYNGDLLSSDIIKHFGFNSEKLARMCFSFKGLSLFDRAEFERVLRRVRMFGFEHSLASDKIYAQLYQYLLESDIPCGPKKKPVSSYGIRFALK